ncbi:MAG: methyltransferase domain-containing protein [Saccharolobus sp.]
MSSLFDSLNAWSYKVCRRMGMTIDEELFYAKMLNKIVKGKVKYSSALEIGCCNCLFSLNLGNTISIDLWDEIPLEEVKKYASSQLVQNLFPLPFRDNTFDLIYSPIFFSNLKRDVRKELAKDVYRVIRKENGILILIDLEIFRKIRKEFIEIGFEEKDYYTYQGVFFSIMQANRTRSIQ